MTAFSAGQSNPHLLRSLQHFASVGVPALLGTAGVTLLTAKAVLRDALQLEWHNGRLHWELGAAVKQQHVIPDAIKVAWLLGAKLGCLQGRYMCMHLHGVPCRWQHAVPRLTPAGLPNGMARLAGIDVLLLHRCAAPRTEAMGPLPRNAFQPGPS